MMTGLPQPLALVAAIAVALLAQWQFDRAAMAIGAALAASAMLLGAAVSRALSSASLIGTRPESAAAALDRLDPRRRLALAVASILALLGVVLMRNNSFTFPGTVAWSAGVLLALAALFDRPAACARQPPNAATGLALIAILAVAALLRFYQLVDLPAEAGCDIPLKLQVVRGMLAGERPIYSAVFPGREVGFFYVTALYGAVFGADQPALKTVSVLFSLLTVGALYVLGARWFGRLVGLGAAAWLALSPWHLSISRIGYRGVLTPLMVVLALLALDRALGRGARRDWAWLGVVIGVCGYTYTASAAIAFAAAGVSLVASRQAARRRGWAMALLLAVLLALPLLRVATTDFALLSQRARSRLEDRQAYDVGQRLLGNAGRSLMMFNVRGDEIEAQNVRYRRMLGLVSGGLFLCGAGIALARWRQRRIALTLWFLMVMQLPSALALAFPNDVPGAVRGSGALIPACLLSALPLALLWEAWRQRVVARGRQAVALAVALLAAVLLLTEGRETAQRYFVEYAAGLPFGNYPFSRTIAAALDRYAGRGPVYLFNYPYWLDGNALRAQLVRLPLDQLHEAAPLELDAQLAAVAPPFLVVLKPDDGERLDRLRARFPQLHVERYGNARGEAMFETVEVEP
jgi:hypothetical protein